MSKWKEEKKKEKNKQIKLLIYEVSGDMPSALGSGWCPGWVGGPCGGPASKFFNNWLSHVFVDLSSCKHAENVLSRNWSGKHCLSAKSALK